jgi:hypothetical protein
LPERRVAGVAGDDVDHILLLRRAIRERPDRCNAVAARELHHAEVETGDQVTLRIAEGLPLAEAEQPVV